MPSAEGAAKRVASAILGAPQDIRKLAAKLPPVEVNNSQNVSNYNAAGRRIAVASAATPDELIHEYFHHIDYGLAKIPFKTVSVDQRTIIGLEFHLEIERLGKLGEDGKATLEGRIGGNRWLDDLFSALTFNRIGQGHSLQYWIADSDRRFREAFSDLGTLYSTGEWSRVKSTLPDLAEAFEQWLNQER